MKSVSIGLMCVCSNAYSYTFTPTEFEFENWDFRCKALYLSTDAGRASPFAGRVPIDIAMQYFRESSGGPWHYCKGLSMLARARMSLNKVERVGYLNKAIGEISYTYKHAKKGSLDKLYANVYLAEAYRQNDELKMAEDLLKPLIVSKTDYDLVYKVMYLVLRDKGDKKAAIDMLILATSTLKNSIAEIYYFLGLEYFDLNNMEEARKYAELAYSKGYPLRGLRDKLESLDKKN